jgi:hypothetical protein
MGAASKGYKFAALKKKWKNLSKDDIIKEYVEKWHNPGSADYVREEYEDHIENFIKRKHKNTIADIESRYEFKIENLKYQTKFLTGVFVGIILVLTIIILNLQDKLYG